MEPIWSIPYPVPKLKEEIFKNEVERLFLIWLFERANDLEWGSPFSAHPKHKWNQVRFISDFRNINKKLKHKPYPMPNINDMLLKLEGFQYATPLDLKMG